MFGSHKFLINSKLTGKRINIFNVFYIIFIFGSYGARQMKSKEFNLKELNFLDFYFNEVKKSAT